MNSFIFIVGLIIFFVGEGIIFPSYLLSHLIAGGLMIVGIAVCAAGFVMKKKPQAAAAN
ncbi:MAG: hypothetical protein QW767_04060 [Thermoprotei archaeon]